MNEEFVLTCEELLSRIDTRWAEFIRALDQNPLDTWDAPGACGWWSIGEMVSHISYWESQIAEYIQRDRLGTPRSKSFGSPTVDEQNLEVGSQSRFEPNLFILRRLFQTHDQIFRAIAECNDPISPKLLEGIACETWDHYPEHSAQLVAWAEANQTAGSRYLAIQEGMIAMAEALPDDLRTEPGVTEDWSAKDLLGHLQFWDEFRIHRLDHKAGRIAALPNIGTDVDDINTKAAADRSGWSWDETVAALRTIGAKLAPMLTTDGEDGLTGPIHEHYLEHAPDLRNAVYDGLIADNH